MKEYEVIYSMGGRAYGCYFKSLVAAYDSSNVKSLLFETHGLNISITCIVDTKNPPNCKYEQVLTTIEA